MTYMIKGRVEDALSYSPAREAGSPGGAVEHHPIDAHRRRICIRNPKFAFPTFSYLCTPNTEQAKSGERRSLNADLEGLRKWRPRSKNGYHGLGQMNTRSRIVIAFLCSD